jgi:hypothetical protein
MQFKPVVTKSLLRLCDEVLELADRYNLEEAKLRHILQLDANDQLELVQQIIQHNLTTKQIQ